MTTVKKITLFVVLEVLAITLSGYLSAILHSTLLRRKIDPAQLTHSLIVTSMRENEQHLLLFLCISGLLTLGLIMLIFLNRKYYKSTLIPVTSDILTPAPAGQKQHGSARWMTEREKERRFTGNAGVVVGMKKNFGVEKIYTVGDDVHTLCIGATRSGKSRRVVLQTIGVLAKAGESMILADAKAELHDYTSEFLKENGYDIIVIDFKNPLKSDSYNFLKPVIDAVDRNDIPKAIEHAWDLTSVLVGEARGEKIWTNGEASVIASSIMSVVYDNRSGENKRFLNMGNVYHFIAQMNQQVNGKTPMEGYIRDMPDTHPAKGLMAIGEIAPQRTKASFFTSALTTLRLFTNPMIHAMSRRSDFDLADIAKEKTALFIVLPDDRVSYYSLASLLVSQFYAALVNEADKRGGRLQRRVNFVLDEYGNFAAIPDFAVKLTVGGGRGIRFDLFVQSLSQLDEKYGKDVSRIIQANCEVWIYLQANDLGTLEEISKKLGKYTVSTYSVGSNSARYSTSSQSENVSLMARELLTVDEVKLLNKPYALVISKEHPAVMFAPDISEYEFNKLFGMGDAEYNRLLREEREARRRTKDYDPSELELWDIAKFYIKKLQREQQLARKNFKSIKDMEETNENNEI